VRPTRRGTWHDEHTRSSFSMVNHSRNDIPPQR
jgi:hypothetical protein